MKILVTGCHGFVGHYTCEQLLARGHTIVGTERLHRPRSNKSERIAVAPQIEVVGGDISDSSFVDSLMSSYHFDVVLHCAAQFPVKHSTSSVESYIASNLSGFLRIMETCRVHKVGRVIYTSSLVAATSGRPTNLYGATKRFNEEAAHVFSCHGLETIGIRLAQVYGPMMRQDAGIWRLGKALKGGLPIGHRTGFGRKREQVEVREAADVLASVIDVDLSERNPVVLACADDFKADYGDVIYELSRAMGIKPRYPAGYSLSPRDQRADVEPLVRLGAYVPKKTLREGMSELVDHL